MNSIEYKVKRLTTVDKVFGDSVLMMRVDIRHFDIWDFRIVLVVESCMQDAFIWIEQNDGGI